MSWNAWKSGMRFSAAAVCAATLLAGCRPAPGPTSFVTTMGDGTREKDPGYKESWRKTEEKLEADKRRREERARARWEKKEQERKEESERLGIPYEKRPYVPPGTPTIGPVRRQKTPRAPRVKTPVSGGTPTVRPPVRRSCPGGASTGRRVGGCR